MTNSPARCVSKLTAYDVLDDIPSGPKLELTLDETPPNVCNPGIAGMEGMPLGDTPSNFKVRTTVSPTITDSRSSVALKLGLAPKSGQDSARPKEQEQKPKHRKPLAGQRFIFLQTEHSYQLVLPVCIVWRKFPLGFYARKKLRRTF